MAQHQFGLHVENGLHAAVNRSVSNTFIGKQFGAGAFYSFTPRQSPIGIDASLCLNRDRFFFDFDPYHVILLQRLFSSRLLVTYKINSRGHKILFGFGAGVLLHKFNEIGYSSPTNRYYYGYSNIDSLYAARPFQVNICAGYHLSLGKKQRWGIRFLLAQQVKSILLKEYKYALFYGTGQELVVPEKVFPLTATIGIRFALNKTGSS